MATTSSPSSGSRRPSVLRISHSSVVSEYRHRDRRLREDFGYDLHLVTPERWPEGGQMVTVEPEPSELPVHVARTHGRQHPALFWYSPTTLRRLLVSVRPDVVDLHEEPFSLAVAAALPLIHRYAPTAAICIYTAQNLPKHYPPPFSWSEARALRASVCAYPCSLAAGDRLRTRGFTGAIDVIPLGVTLPKLDPSSRPAGSVIGFVGRLEPYKGGSVAIEAFARIARSSDASLVVVGSGSEEPALRALAERSGLGSRIHFTGAVSQDAAIRHISGMDVLLVPSISTPTWIEQFGRVAAQGMAAGCVVIASDSGALPEVVGEAGILVREGDVNALADAVLSVLADPHERRRLAALARGEARRFGWQAVAADVAAMYERALSEGPRTHSAAARAGAAP